jgi:hypothetical protein
MHMNKKCTRGKEEEEEEEERGEGLFRRSHIPTIASIVS